MVKYLRVSILTGIGFTMSLFVGNLAFANDLQYIDGVKIGVLTGSLLSTVFGYFIINIHQKKMKLSKLVIFITLLMFTFLSKSMPNMKNFL